MESQCFVYPHARVVTNNNQVKHLQNKLLINSYQQNVLTKKLKGSIYISPKQQQTKNQLKSSYYQGEEQPRIFLQNQIKKTWANQLDEQIRMKQIREKKQKINNLQEQSKYVKNNKILLDIQKIRQIQFLKNAQKQAEQSLQQKQFKKYEQKNNQLQQKEYFRKRYSLNNLAFEAQNLTLNKNISDPTKNYYNQIIQQRKSLGMQDNPTYTLRPNDEFKRAQIKKMSHLSPSQLIKVQEDYFQKQRKNQHQIQLSLKETLLEQIKNSQTKKKKEKQKQFNSPYANPQYKYVYHPIYNPVDIKVAKDNPYIFKQFADGVSEKSSIQNQTGSYLSRKGSQSLLK